MKLEDYLALCVKNNNLVEFKSLINQATSYQKYEVAVTVAELDRVDFILFLLTFSDIDFTQTNNYLFRRSIRFNSFHVANALIKDKRIDPSDAEDYALSVAADNVNISLIKLLLKDKRVNPATNRNTIINNAYSKKRAFVVELLWSSPRIKETLKNDNIELFEILTKHDLQKKIKAF